MHILLLLESYTWANLAVNWVIFLSILVCFWQRNDKRTALSPFHFNSHYMEMTIFSWNSMFWKWKVFCFPGVYNSSSQFRLRKKNTTFVMFCNREAVPQCCGVFSYTTTTQKDVWDIPMPYMSFMRQSALCGLSVARTHPANASVWHHDPTL